MKTFEEIYQEIQNMENNTLNDMWKKTKKENRKGFSISVIICLIIDILFLVYFFNGNISSDKYSTIFILFKVMFVLVINMVIFVVVPLFFDKNKVKYNSMYKDIIIKKLINNFYTNLEYFPYKEMPEYIYNELNYEFYNVYKSDDYFEAQIDNKYNIQMGEVWTQDNKSENNSDGDVEMQTVTKFHGLFSKITIDKSINSELRIVQSGILKNKNTLNMDSSEFEKYFNVNTSDKILAMQLLTADVMEELIEFFKSTNIEYDICIKNNEIYLRFHSGQMFEVISMKKDSLNKNDIYRYFSILNFTYNLSKKLINLINELLI